MTQKIAFTAACIVVVTATGSAAAEDDPRAAAFRAHCAARAEQAGEAMTVRGRNNWLFLRKELRHLGVGRFWGVEAVRASRATRAERRDPLPVILDVHNQLDALGIRLLLVPVPPKAVVYPVKLWDDVRVASNSVPRLDCHHQAFYALLREHGVEVVDLFPELAEPRDGNPRMYCRSDTHWSGQACVVAARRIAAMLKEAPWYAATDHTPSQTEEQTVRITGDLGRALPDGDPARTESLPLRVVSGGDGKPLDSDPHSPVLVMADSHGLVFHQGGDMHAHGAGFWDQLAHELQLRPSLIAVRGSGATPTRIRLYKRGQADPEFLSSKKVVIWLFAAREFTETTGWAKLPVMRSRSF